MKVYKKVLTIAGSDSGGGAGIQADIKTISALGCYATSAITAITAQNTKGVTAIHPVPIDMLEKQLEAILSDIGTDSVKIGMLHNVDVVKVVARALQKYGVKQVVLDPVMVATSGDRLIEEDTLKILKKELFPLASIITPNLDEAEMLLDRKIASLDEMEKFAADLAQWNSGAVLLKGGHLEGDTIFDVYFDTELKESRVFHSCKIESANVHGTGCTLSSAIASYMAIGYTSPEAVIKARDFVLQAIESGKDYQTGSGHGPVNHFFDPKVML